MIAAIPSGQDRQSDFRTHRNDRISLQRLRLPPFQVRLLSAEIGPSGCNFQRLQGHHTRRVSSDCPWQDRSSLFACAILSALWMCRESCLPKRPTLLAPGLEVVYLHLLDPVSLVNLEDPPARRAMGKSGLTVWSYATFEHVAPEVRMFPWPSRSISPSSQALVARAKLSTRTCSALTSTDAGPEVPSRFWLTVWTSAGV